jgi:hypothetical protein
MCSCYGCDSLLDKLVVDNKLCANSTTGTRMRRVYLHA